MIVSGRTFLAIASWLLCPCLSFAQPAETEPAAVLELGAAPGWSLKDRVPGFGPTLAVEVTPVENWLELEAGLTPAFSRHSTEWGTDLLFKKPWTLSAKAEFMFGIGPEWIRTNDSALPRNSLAGEAVLDFMFWPSQKHRLGWYLEPGCEYNFGRGRERSLAIAFGLLIAIP